MEILYCEYLREIKYCINFYIRKEEMKWKQYMNNLKIRKHKEVRTYFIINKTILK